jgi:prepilin-type N-terminal cleavage/methylation domain-containing protein
MIDNTTLLRCHGFTILEVILVLVLISIFAAIAVARQPNPDVRLMAQKVSLESHIRYTQMRSMNSDGKWGIAVSTDQSGYWLFKDTTTEKRILPGEDQVEIDLTSKGISISFSSESTNFSFDDWGRPMSGDNYLSSALNIDLKKSDGSDTRIETLVVTPETGFVQ